MFAFNLVMVLLGGIALFVVARAGGEALEKSSTPIALQLGRSALDELGWGLGVTTTIVFGCLVASAGGQVFFGDTSEEARLRRSLGVLSELTVSAMLPVTLLALAASTLMFMAGWRYGVGYVSSILIPLASRIQGLVEVGMRPVPRRLGPVGRATIHRARRTAGRTLKNAHRTLVELDPRDEPAESDLTADPGMQRSTVELPSRWSKWQRIAAIVLER